MSRIRKRGNRSTESRLRGALVAAGITGWRMHQGAILGRPDFAFPAHKVAVFVDGCFWHLCPSCGRPPSSNLGYWRPKLEGNRERDHRTTTRLRRMGWRVLRLWEHEIADARKAADLVRRAVVAGGR